MSDQLVGVLRGSLTLGVILAIAALIDMYRKRRSPGPRLPKKLTRREVYWVTLIVILLVLLGLPVGSRFTPPRSDNRPVTIAK